MVPLPFRDVYSIVFWIALLIWAIPEWFGSVTQRATGTARRRDRGSSLVVLLCNMIGLATGFTLAFALPGATLAPATLVFGVGIVFMLLGVALRWYAVRTLGRYFTRNIAVQQEQSVVQAGPYKYIRHPSYSGALLTLLGIGLALTNWASVLVIALCCGFGYGYRIHAEERILREGLGQPYAEYMRHTKRLIPFVL